MLTFNVKAMFLILRQSILWFILLIYPWSLLLVTGYIMLDRKEKDVWKCLVYEVQSIDDEDLQNFWYLDPLLCFGLV